MRKNAAMLFVFSLFVASVVLAATWSTGEGRKVTATTTAARIDFLTTVNTVSVYNSDATNEVHALTGVTTNEFAVRYAAGTTVVIPAKGSYTFDARERASIGNLTYRADNGTAIVYIAGY